MTKYILILLAVISSSKIVASERNQDEYKIPDNENIILNSMDKISVDYKKYKNSCTGLELDARWGNGYFPNGGVRSLYCHFKPMFNLKIFESTSANSVFVKGPHENGELNLYSKNTFGHYNPEFVKWLNREVIPEKEDTIRINATLPIYNYYVKDIARIYYTVNKSINVNSKFKNNILEKYKKDIKNINGVDIYEYNECPNLTSKWPKAYPIEWGKKYYVSSTAMLFWLRREIDGTNVLFNELFTKLLQSYDSDFMAAVNDANNSYHSGNECYRQVYD